MNKKLVEEIWEALKNGGWPTDIAKEYPDNPEVEYIAERMMNAYEKRWGEISFAFFVTICKIKDPYHNRQKYFSSIANQKDRKYYLLMLEDQSIKDLLWDEIKPKDEYDYSNYFKRD